MFSFSITRCVYKAGASSMMSLNGQVRKTLFFHRLIILTKDIPRLCLIGVQVTDFQMWDEILPENLLIDVCTHFL